MDDPNAEQLKKEAWRVYGRLKQILMDLYSQDYQSLHEARCALLEVEAILPDLDEDA